MAVQNYDTHDQELHIPDKIVFFDGATFQPGQPVLVLDKNCNNDKLCLAMTVSCCSDYNSFKHEGIVNFKCSCKQDKREHYFVTMFDLTGPPVTEFVATKSKACLTFTPWQYKNLNFIGVEFERTSKATPFKFNIGQPVVFVIKGD